MASSIIVLNQTPTQSATTSSSNETASQHTKLKINLNDVVVTTAAAVADSIQLSNGSLISPCSINKTGPLMNTIILSEELNSNLAKTLKENQLNKFSMSDSNLHKRISSGEDENKTKSQEIYISNLTISDDKKNETLLNHGETKHTRFKIRYHYNTYSNYQSYNEDRINSAGSNSSDSSTSSVSPVLSTDSNSNSPLVNDLNTFPDPLSTGINNTTNSKLDDSSHAFKISSILVSSKLKEEETTKSTDDDPTSASSTVKVKMIANLKIQPNTSRSQAVTPNETSLQRQTAYHEHNTDVNLDEKSLAVNGKSIANEVDSSKSTLNSPKLAVKSQASMAKKEKKRVSFNDSLLQVHLIPNVSYNSLSIEKFKYQLKTTTITMENNSEFDEENEVINYENIPVTSSPSPCSSTSFSSNARSSAEPATKQQQVNFNFYRPQQSETNTDQSNNKTSFVLSSSLISSYNQNESSNYMQRAQAAATNSKMYRTTIFKTFNTNESSSESGKHTNEPTPMPRQSNANKSSVNYRINSGHHRSRESNNTPQDNESTASFSSKFNKKKDTQQINYIIGSSTTNATINKNDPIYQNHRSYSSLLASTFSSQPNLVTNYPLTNKLQIKQQQQQQPQQAQLQIQSNNLSIPFHASTTVSNDELNSKTNSPTKTKAAPTIQHTNDAKNENAILRVNSGTPGKHANKASNKSEQNITSSETNKNEVHQSLAMSFELTPQLKFLSNLKTPKQTTNIFINNAEIKDLIDDENKKDLQPQSQSHINRKILTATSNSNNQETNLSAPIIANLSAGLFKQKFSSKPGSTKFIFLKSDDKQTDTSFSSNHFNTLNKSFANHKIGFSSSNSLASSSATSNPSESFSQFSDVVKLDTTNSKNAGFNSNAKNLAMSTVNQLFALKDVNYYVTNSTKTLKKYHQHQAKTNLNNKNNNNFGNSNLVNSSANSTGEVTTIRLHSFSQNQIQQNDRQTKSALPLLRSSIKLNQAGSSTNLIVDASSTSKPSTPTISMTPTETKNLSNCFNNLSYRLINTPTLIGNLHKAKSFLYNQTTTSSSSTNNFEKRIKETTNDKTSL